MLLAWPGYWRVTFTTCGKISLSVRRKRISQRISLFSTLRYSRYVFSYRLSCHFLLPQRNAPRTNPHKSTIQYYTEKEEAYPPKCHRINKRRLSPSTGRKTFTSSIFADPTGSHCCWKLCLSIARRHCDEIHSPSVFVHPHSSWGSRFTAILHRHTALCTRSFERYILYLFFR